MILEEPPYELVALFADRDMESFFEALLERAQQKGRGCTRPFRWRSERHPGRDLVWRTPELILRPFFATGCRFLVAWDHQGSGREGKAIEESQSRVLSALKNCGVAEDCILAVALEPEVERLLKPVWPRVKEVVAKEAGVAVPEDGVLLNHARQRASRRRPGLVIPDEMERALESVPKEVFEALVVVAGLRRVASLYRKIGEEVSLRNLKRDAVADRIARQIAAWFPPA